MRKLNIISFLIFLSFIFIADATKADDFGEGNKNVREYLDETNEEDGENVEGSDEENNAPPVTDQEDVQEDQIGGGQNLFFLTLQMFAALGAVLLGIYVLLKLINKRAQKFSSHSTIQNIGGVGVGSNRSVQIVRVGERLFVVGVGETVELLKEIDDPNELEQMMKSHQQSQEFFNEPMNRVSGWLKSKKSNQTSDSNEGAFRSLLDREMKQVKDSQKKVHSALEEKDR